VLILTDEKEYKASGFVLHPEYMTQLHVFVNLSCNSKGFI